MTIFDLTDNQIREISILAGLRNKFNIERKTNGIQVGGGDYYIFIHTNLDISRTYTDFLSGTYKDLRISNQRVIQSKFIEWGIEPTAKVLPLNSCANIEPKKPKQYVGVYRKGGNVGDIWTQQQDGKYSCPNKGFNISQSDVDSDVKNGYLVEVRDSRKVEVVEEKTAPIFKPQEKPWKDFFEDYRRGIYPPVKTSDTKWEDFIKEMRNAQNKLYFIDSFLSR